MSSFRPFETLIEARIKCEEVFDFTVLDPVFELYSEDNGKYIGKMKMETAQELDLYEAIFLRVKSYCNKIKPYHFKSKHKGVQEHNQYTLEDYKLCFERSEEVCGIFSSFRGERREISVVKQPKIASKTFDDERC